MNGSWDAYLATPADFSGVDDIITNLAKVRAWPRQRFVSSDLSPQWLREKKTLFSSSAAFAVRFHGSILFEVKEERKLLVPGYSSCESETVLQIITLHVSLF